MIKLILISLVILAVVLGAAYWLNGERGIMGEGGERGEMGGIEIGGMEMGIMGVGGDKGEEGEEKGANGENGGNGIFRHSDISTRYTDTRFGFSFGYPGQFNVGAFDDDNGRTVLVQRTEGGGSEGVQIYIQPFDEQTAITKERVLRDLPDTVIKNPLTVKLARAAAGLAFDSFEPGLGDTFEVWFARAGQLYQIKTRAKDKGAVAEIFRTWRFGDG